MIQRTVETFSHESIKDEPLPAHIEGFAPGAEFIENLLANCPFVVTAPYSEDGLPFGSYSPHVSTTAAPAEITEITGYHGRSFAVVHPDLKQPWHDEFGNTYTSLNLKGNNFSNPEVISHPTASERYIAYGLQESIVSRRVLRASRLLRENGIGTEYILGLAEPKVYGWPNVDSKTDSMDYLFLPEYKQRLVEKGWQQLPEQERSAETYVAMARAFQGMTFFVSARAMDTSYRIQDIVDSSSARQEVFSYINQHLLPEGEAPLDAETVVDFPRYTQEFLLPRMATNLAKLHKLGLAHRYPNELNITALGSLVDLDSVHGEPLGLGDEPITADDIVQDLRYAAAALDALSSRHNLLTFGKQESFNAKSAFIAAYIEELSNLYQQEPDGEVLLREHLLELAASSHHFANGVKSGTEEYLIAYQIERQLMEQYGNRYLAEEKAAANQAVDDWLAKHWEVIEPALLDRVREQIGWISSMIIQDCVAEYGNVVWPSPVKLLQSSTYDRPGVAARGELEIDLERCLMTMYRNHIPDTPEGTITMNDTATLVKRFILVEAIDWETKLYPQVKGFLDANLEKLREPLEAACDSTTPNIAFPDIESSLSIATAEGVVARETHVPTHRFAQYIAETQDEIVLETQSPDHRIPDSFACKLTDDGSLFIQTITDGAIEGCGNNTTLPVENWEVYTAGAHYAAFVELKPGGTRRVRLQINDSESFMRAHPQPTRQEIAHYMQSLTAYQGSLFHAAQYDNDRILVKQLLDVLRQEVTAYIKI